MFVDPASVDIPVDMETLFNRHAPVTGEIGCGSGYFLTEAARQDRHSNFLAAEVHSPSVLRTFKRVRQAELTNVRLYHGDGRFLLRDLVTARSLSAVYVNFPNPWPKQKHADKRLLDRSFFTLLSSRLADNAATYVTTDHHDYFRWALRQASETDCFDVEEKPPPPGILQSRYARKWQSADRSIYHAEFRKTAHTSIQPTFRRLTMQHSVLEGSLPDLTDFEPIVHSFDGHQIVIKRVLQPLANRDVMFEVHLEEDGLTQDLLLRVRVRADSNRLVLGVDPFGRPLATKGVAEAVRLLTAWMAEHGLTVVDRSY